MRMYAWRIEEQRYHWTSFPNISSSFLLDAPAFYHFGGNNHLIVRGYVSLRAISCHFLCSSAVHFWFQHSATLCLSLLFLSPHLNLERERERRGPAKTSDTICSYSKVNVVFFCVGALLVILVACVLHRVNSLLTLAPYSSFSVLH